MKKRDWKNKAILLCFTGLISQRGIARALMIPKSTCNDAIRKWKKEKEVS